MYRNSRGRRPAVAHLALDNHSRWSAIVKGTHKGSARLRNGYICHRFYTMASTSTVTGTSSTYADIAAIERISAVPTILRVVSEVTGLRLALVARVTQTSWTACAVLDRMNFGLHVGGQLAVATTLCSEVRDSHVPLIIEHASREPEYCAHPTPKMYGFESYIAVPIFRAGGEYFGNICALDSNPAILRDDKTLAMMRLFAELIELQLTAEEESVRDREALVQERQTAALREEFIAVLGHDLRNPLSAVLAGSAHLLSLPMDETSQRVLGSIRGGGQRMAKLIDDIMDFARGRLGGGMLLTREPTDVQALVTAVVAEIVSAHPTRAVRIDVSKAGHANLDASRSAQMLSNLVANAIEHGEPEQPIEVSVERVGKDVVLTVTSRGRQIPSSVRSRLFQPFFRGESSRPSSGLGLGLYIASEIARAHGGSIAAESTADGTTTFTVRLRDEGDGIPAP
jgi:signal transduction histidine kinase